MAGWLLVLTTTTALLGWSSASPDSDNIQVRNTTFPTVPGGELRLTCTSTSDDDDLYWVFVPHVTPSKIRILDENTNKYRISSDESAWTSNLTVLDVQISDEGLYKCESQHEGDNDTYLYDMPLGPRIIASKRRLPVGDDFTIMCMVDGYSEDTISWSFTGINGTLYNSTDFKELVGGASYPQSNRIDNKTGSFLKLSFYHVGVQMSGTYTCTAEGKTVSTTIQVKGFEVDCADDGVLYVEPPADASFTCEIVTLVRFNVSNISIRKYVGTSKGGWSIDKQREIVSIVKQSDRITTTFKFIVRQLMWSDDNTKYNVNIKDTDIVFELSLMIDQPLQQRCQGRTCPGNYICNTNYLCICPQGMKPDPDKMTMCSDRDSSRDSEESGGDGDRDVTIVKHSSVATAVGVSMGVLGLIVIIILGFVCYWRRKKQKLTALNAQARGHYLDPSYLYQYEYHSEANMLKENPTVCNPGYLAPPIRIKLRKENTYVETAKGQLEFPREQLQLGVDLGQGRFGKVIQARAMNISGSGKWERVAVKTCRGTATDSEKQDLYQELEIMRKIPDHPNIVHLLGCCSMSDPLYIIMEYVQRGSMLNYLRKCRPSSRVSSDSAISSLQSNNSFMQPRAKDLTIFALQIARGMAHVASIGIIHRDLAARNILLGTDFTCKICDFGLARDVEGVDVYERVSKGPLPIRWMAPEALADNMYTRKSDVWSYGILLWEIVTLGATPYTGMSAMEVMRHVLQGYNLPRPLHCKSEMYQLMECCWTDATERPSFADIVTHQEDLMDDDYIVLSDYDENDYGWLDSYTLDERV